VFLPANSYDKYGRVLASYTYDPTLPDSLKQLWATTQYDLGGKVLSATKYPYGYSFTSIINRDVKESYVYDRLGRVSKIVSSYGNTPETELARYEYYPTGSVKTVVLGNSLTLSYTYHISGAMKRLPSCTRLMSIRPAANTPTKAGRTGSSP
jgi:hypothetical protein